MSAFEAIDAVSFVPPSSSVSSISQTNPSSSASSSSLSPFSSSVKSEVPASKFKDGNEKIKRKDRAAKIRLSIQWDEETIEEHNKERGTRQKIDEAPTPYRYSSESDMSEGEGSEKSFESGYSSGSPSERESLSDIAKDAVDGDNTVGKNSTEPGKKNSKSKSRRKKAAFDGSVMDQWSTLEARLNYEQYRQQKHSSKSSKQNTDGEIDVLSGEECTSPRNDKSSSESVDWTNEMGAEGEVESCRTRVGAGMKVSSPEGDGAGGKVAGSSGSGGEDSGRSKDGSGSGSGSDDGMEVDPSVAGTPLTANPKKAQKAMFQNKRSQHYNEYKVLQAMREKRAQGSDEDDDDD